MSMVKVELHEPSAATSNLSPTTYVPVRRRACVCLRVLGVCVCVDEDFSDTHTYTHTG